MHSICKTLNPFSLTKTQACKSQKQLKHSCHCTQLRKIQQYQNQLYKISQFRRDPEAERIFP